MWKIIKTETNKQSKREDGICFFKGNNKGMCHQKLLIPLKNFFSLQMTKLP